MNSLEKIHYRVIVRICMSSRDHCTSIANGQQILHIRIILHMHIDSCLICLVLAILYVLYLDFMYSFYLYKNIHRGTLATCTILYIRVQRFLKLTKSPASVARKTSVIIFKNILTLCVQYQRPNYDMKLLKSKSRNLNCPAKQSRGWGFSGYSFTSVCI